MENFAAAQVNQTASFLLHQLNRAVASGQAAHLHHIDDVKQSGLVYLRGGKILHAETTAERGTNALFEIVEWNYIEFAYDRTVRAPVETITTPWDDALVEAVTLHKQHKAIGSHRQRA